MDMNKYIEIFIEESKEHLQGLNSTLLELEKNPKEINLVNEIFRIAHTLKGMASTMGYTKMTKLTHVMEDALHFLRTGERKLDSGMIDSLFKCLDALEGYVGSIIENGNEGNEVHQNLINKLMEIVQRISSGDKSMEAPVEEEAVIEDVRNLRVAQQNKPLVIVEGELFVAAHDQYPVIKLDEYEFTVLKKAVDLDHKVYRIDMSLDKGCLLKSARAFIFFQTLERHGEVIKTLPKPEDIEEEKFDLDLSCILVSKSSHAQLTHDLERLSEVSKHFVKLLDLNTTVFENRNTVAEEIPMEDVMGGDEEMDESQQVANGRAKKSKLQKMVRVDIGRLDVLMNLVSELIIVKTRLEGIKAATESKENEETVEYLDRITSSLHDAVMKVRMVPVESVFNRFPRMIRDIAKSLGKEIELKMSGEETELDRTVIDEIGDPLIHILRNSVDHGIEPKDTRQKNGKSPVGHIHLQAYQDGNSVVIQVDDDGGGINLNKVKNKAIEKGLVTKQNAANLTPKEIIEFMFDAGFSTADQITDLSGRGVGLDVVRTKIESLGGFVEVNTEEGKGTQFIIRLPLTLAIIQALMVMVGNEKYAIPLSNIQEIINVNISDIKIVQQRETLLLRDNIVPIIWLSKVLDVPQDQLQNTTDYTVIIVKKSDKSVGVVVDNLIGQHEVVIKSLGKLMEDLKIIAGATIMGDGNVALIVDVNYLN